MIVPAENGPERRTPRSMIHFFDAISLDPGQSD
jgi:hypothetical protein